MKLQRTLTASLALLIISASGLAAAGPEKKEKRDKDVLRGPKVTQTTTTDRPANERDARDSMKDQSDKAARKNKGKDKGKDRADQPISFRDYQLAIRQINNKRAAQALNITSDQQEKIKVIIQEHRQAMQAFLEQHKDKIAKMRQSMKQSKGNQHQKTSAQDRSAIEPANKDTKRAGKRDNRGNQAREKLRNFLDNAPANKEALAKLSRVLTPDQLDAIKSHIKSTRAKRANRPDQPQRDKAKRGQSEKDQRSTRDKQDSNNTQTDRPSTQRRNINKNSVRSTDKKDARQNKKSKSDKPASKDD